ncbi:hypothetical protein [Leisingera sp. ANG-M1]|nr:hypothetical protein [Leisingera sp. ANG-M1]
MWFEPLAEAGALLAGCAALLGAAVPFFKKSEGVRIRVPARQKAHGGSK